ncbi:hypothetical protein OG440_32500 [Streptomyces sp. NBC_00637]|uniref:hypothetical protein n=1 Tax=Streptomyces sp. NBC_00637 TaxID=2903667 RepID=UPI003249709F
MRRRGSGRPHNLPEDLFHSLRREEHRVRAVWGALALLCLVTFVCALPYAIHVGGQTLPEGQSLPTLLPISVVALFGTFVAGPTFWSLSRRCDGVSLYHAPEPRRQHQIRAVREPSPLSTGSPAARRR